MTADRVLEEDSWVYFLNIPPGRMRAVVETDQGDLCTTPFFEVNRGGCVTMEVSVDESEK